MYCDKYAPWDHYPKSLRFSEIQYPLSVVEQFFDLNWPEGHFESLKTWRYFVINYESYDHKHGPGNLLSIYEASLKLLEALYLLYLEKRESHYASDVDEAQLEKEEQQWFWFPENLSDEELTDPYRVIKCVFKKIKPQEFRDYLHEWIDFALATNAIEESMSAKEIIVVYKKLKKLYSIAWLIRQRETERPVLKRETNPVIPITENAQEKHSVIIENDPQVALIKQTPAEKLALKEVASAVIKAEPEVKAIIHIGTLQQPKSFILYILLDDLRCSFDYKLNELIENAAKPLIPVFTIIESANILKDGKEQKRSFLAYAMTKGIIIYQAAKISLPTKLFANVKANSDKQDGYYHRKLKVAKAYFAEISLHLDKGTLQLALHSVHQSLESAIEGLLGYKTGYKTLSPKLNRLVKMTQLFTNDVADNFKQLEISHPELYTLLENVYPESSRNALEISLSQMQQLKTMTSDLHSLISGLMDEKTDLSIL